MAIVFRSNGKLLISGEYVVLRGALALAIPLRLGQTLEVQRDEAHGHPHILWNAFSPGNKLWFRASYELPTFDIIGTSDRDKSVRLQTILLTLNSLKPEAFDAQYSYRVITRLEFEPQWGFGSSSTLLASLARWAKCDPYTLLNLSIGGSGYDIACASSSKPILYRREGIRPVIRQAAFFPPFHDKLYFVYQGQKQDSNHQIVNFNRLTENLDLAEIIGKVSAISQKMAETSSQAEFGSLMHAHEQLLSGLLKIPPVKTFFPDFEGELKSLGAWGGDFMLALCDKGDDYVQEYFAGQQLDTIFKYSELALNG
ncbi:MAG: GHMP kinase [Bacteroidetes bacterium]|nr:GHMP kinase [Bacteroidota bacterium]